MNPLIKNMPNVKKFNEYMLDVKTGKTPLMLSGLTDSGKVHLAYSTRFYGDKPKNSFKIYNFLAKTSIIFLNAKRLRLTTLQKVKIRCLTEFMYSIKLSKTKPRS